MNRLAVYRAIWGFLVFIPFCWAWGINNFTLFSVAGTLYFIPMHWFFDRLFVQGITITVRADKRKDIAGPLLPVNKKWKEIFNEKDNGI